MCIAFYFLNHKKLDFFETEDRGYQAKSLIKFSLIANELP